MNNLLKYLHDIETDGTDLTDCLKTDGFEKLEDLYNLSINVFELNENTTLTQVHISKVMNKIVDSQEKIYRDILNIG